MGQMKGRHSTRADETEMRLLAIDLLAPAFHENSEDDARVIF